MKKIKLTQNKFALVDDEDLPLIAKYKWCAHYERGRWYAISGTTQIKMHRLIMSATKQEHVDHKSGNGLDNQKSNLRKCTNQQNQHNKKLQRNNTSGFKGVFWNSQANRWTAKIRYNMKQIYIGNFTDKKLAAISYDKKAKSLFGEFAHTNF